MIPTIDPSPTLSKPIRCTILRSFRSYLTRQLRHKWLTPSNLAPPDAVFYTSSTTWATRHETCPTRALSRMYAKTYLRLNIPRPPRAIPFNLPSVEAETTTAIVHPPHMRHVANPRLAKKVLSCTTGRSATKIMPLSAIVWRTTHHGQ